MSRNTDDPLDLTALGAHIPQASSRTSSTHNSSLNSPSRIPRYVGNGILPHHNLPLGAGPRQANGSSHPSPPNHHAFLAFHSNRYFNLQQQTQMNPYQTVPQPIHIQHQQYMLTHVIASQTSSPNSHLASSSNTPISSHRSSLNPGCVQSATLPAKPPCSSLFQTPNTAKGFRYDEYMPLTELQRALEKGQVLEVSVRARNRLCTLVVITTSVQTL